MYHRQAIDDLGALGAWRKVSRQQIEKALCTLRVACFEVGVCRRSDAADESRVAGRRETQRVVQEGCARSGRAASPCGVGSDFELARNVSVRVDPAQSQVHGALLRVENVLREAR